MLPLLSAAMVRSVSGLARELGLNVVAEDVETPECLAMLRALGCSEVQGHLFGEPLTVEAMPDPPSNAPIAWRLMMRESRRRDHARVVVL